MRDLVPGDIIKVEAGDYVPADARLENVAGVVRMALTGESLPTERTHRRWCE
ncbi:MAG: hypothetical protein ACLVJ6_14120 [Merdibacter sp.]